MHMNQGSPPPWTRDNGVRQDGGFILQFEDHWKGVFIGFASQAVHTKDDPPNEGSPIPRDGYKTWANFSDERREEDDITDTPVIISRALVNPPGPDNQPNSIPETVSLTNRTTKAVDLRWLEDPESSWSI